MKFAASLVIIFIGFFTGTALASGVIEDPLASEVLRQILDAIVNGQWWAAAAGAVIGACALVRWRMPESWKAGTRGDIVGVATAFLMAFAGAVGTWAVTPDAVMSLGVVTAAGKIGIAAIGGYTVLHKAIGWLTAWSGLPPWARTVLNVLAMLIGSSAVKKAEAAGDAAAAANPAPGMDAAGVREVE